MTQNIRCRGLSTSNISRCNRYLGDERQEGRFLTCAIHKDQDGIAQRYTGDPEDDKAIVQHHLQELGLIHPQRPASLEISPPNGAERNDADHIMHERQTPEGDRAGEGPEEYSDHQEFADDELDALRPAYILTRERSGRAWYNFGGELSEADFLDPMDPDAIQKKYGDGFRTAILGVVASHATEIGIVAVPIAALIGAAAIMLNYYFLGFGFQAVTVDKNNLSVAVLVAGMLAITLAVLIKKIIKDKDSDRVKLHSDRYEKVHDLLIKHQVIAENEAKLETSLEFIIRGRERGEASASIAGFISQLEQNEKKKSRFLSALRHLIEKNVSSRLAQSTKEEPAPPTRSEPPTAKEIFDAYDMSAGEKEAALKELMVAYESAEADLEILKDAKDLENEIMDLKVDIDKQNAELKEMDKDKFWFAALLSTRSYVKYGFALLGVLVVKAVFTHVAAASHGYCGSGWELIGPNCYHLEVRRQSGLNATTRLFAPVLYHGRVGDNILISEPFVTAQENTQVQGHELTATAEQSPEPTDAEANSFWSRLGYARHAIPISSVVVMQTYNSTPLFERFGVDKVPPKPAPVFNLAQENSFTVINATAQSSGSQRSGDTHLTNFRTENDFTSEHHNVTNVVTHNDFTNKPVVLPNPNQILTTTFVLDGRELHMPDSEKKRHILVPFFQDPILSPTNEDDEMWQVYAADGEAGISSPVDAFIAGYYSLSDPDYAVGTNEADLASPKNFLSAIKRILQSCTGPTGTPNHTFEIEVLGYASKAPFKDENDQTLSISPVLNHALAEGRRAAVIARLMDFEVASNQDRNSKILPLAQILVVDPQEMPSELIKRLDRAKKLLQLLMDDNKVELTNYLQRNKNKILPILKQELFIFDDETDMHNHLKTWVPIGQKNGDAVQQAFQRSVVVSISHAQMQNCLG